ncbi:MAG: 5'-nucleotidase [Gammaproteobacteria bacterium]
MLLRTAGPKLTIAVSSRALFNLDDSNTLYDQQGIEAYRRYQIAHENEVLAPGVAFPLIKKLLALNQTEHLVEVILLSRNSADTGLRVFNSIEHYQLNITRAAFTNGRSPYAYISAFGAHLFLSANPEDVKQALQTGCAAATILPSHIDPAQGNSQELRLAFDGDSVLFSNESEQVYQTQGLEAFTAQEKDSAHLPLADGPFKGFLMALQTLQSQSTLPIRTALVTARGAPAHERVIRTLRAWDIRIDEALFLGGIPKGDFLKAFGADIFFDDQTGHCDSARQHVATGHVPQEVSG